MVSRNLLKCELAPIFLHLSSLFNLLLPCMNDLKEFQLTAFCPAPGLPPLKFIDDETSGTASLSPSLLAESFEMPG